MLDHLQLNLAKFLCCDQELQQKCELIPHWTINDADSPEEEILISPKHDISSHPPTI